jgi:hypothetical protein
MFVLTPDGKLAAMKPTEFDKELHFQELLTKYPGLLSGELIDPEEPRRWLLVAPEMGIANEENGSSWWSVDHLFLDQDGIPTIVEVKRQSDARLRREVIAQMLDYAANGLARWKVNDLQGRFELECEKRKEEPEMVFQTALALDIEYEKFWEKVKTNLEAKRIRMLLVADFIPRELKTVIEFLNSQMNPAEVLALELKQYTNESGLRTIVPTLFGQTETARGAKASGGGGLAWDAASVFERIQAKSGIEALAVAQRIAEWMQKAGAKINFGRGKVDGSINAAFISKGQKVHPLTISTWGKLYINPGYCNGGTFADPAKRLEWLNRINQIEGIDVQLNVDKYLPIPFATLQVGNRLSELLAVMDWFVTQLSPSEPA